MRPRNGEGDDIFTGLLVAVKGVPFARPLAIAEIPIPSSDLTVRSIAKRYQAFR